MVVASHAYIGRRPCGCVTHLTLDLPNQKRSTDAFIRECLAEGLAVERVTAEDGRQLITYCTCSAMDKAIFEAAMARKAATA